MMTDKEYRSYRNVQRGFQILEHVKAFCGAMVLLAVLVVAWSVVG